MGKLSAIRRSAGHPSGWSVGVVERALATWPSMSLRQIVWEIPASALFALLPAARYREGDESQATPGDQAAALARATVKAWFADHCTILPAA